MATLRPSRSFQIKSISFLILFREDLMVSFLQASMRSSSSPWSWARHPWRSSSEFTTLCWFSARTHSTTSVTVRLLIIRAKSRSRRGPLPCQAASRDPEVVSFPSAAISSRCSQATIQRVLALSMTLTSRVPWNSSSAK